MVTCQSCRRVHARTCTPCLLMLPTRYNGLPSTTNHHDAGITGRPGPAALHSWLTGPVSLSANTNVCLLTWLLLTPSYAVQPLRASGCSTTDPQGAWCLCLLCNAVCGGQLHQLPCCHCQQGFVPLAYKHRRAVRTLAFKSGVLPACQHSNTACKRVSLQLCGQNAHGAAGLLLGVSFHHWMAC